MELVLPRKILSYKDDQPFEIDNSDEISKYQIGDQLILYAGAPGIGQWQYKITKIDEKGLWAELLDCNVRELTPSEVR
jgi:hypothetical protein